MNRLVLDLHVHSNYSYDSFLRVETIIATARKKRIDAVAITDHNTIKGSLYASSINQTDVLIIPAIECKTDAGDLIGLFVNKEINKVKFLDAIAEIKEQGGITLLPHPYKRNCNPQKLMPLVDLVEIFNSRYTEPDNEKAKMLADQFHKPAVVGSDAHSYFEIGNALTIIDHCPKSLVELRGLLLDSSKRYNTKYAPYYISHAISYSASRVKRYLGKIK